MKRAARLGFAILFLCSVSLTVVAQDAGQPAPSDAGADEQVEAEEVLEDEPIEELYEGETAEDETAEEAEAGDLGSEGFMEDTPMLDTSPMPGGALDELIRELTSISTLGPLAAVLFLLILLPLLNILRGQTPRKNTPHLALRYFALQSEESPEQLMEVRGRAPGLIGWSLSDNGDSRAGQPGVVVTTSQIQFIQRSFSENTQHTLPVGEVASAHTAFVRPFWSLALAFMITGITLALFPNLGYLIAVPGSLLTLSCFAHFLTARHVRLTIESTGGVVLSYGFRGNWLEGQKISPEMSVEMMAVLQRIMAIAAAGRSNGQITDNVFQAPRFKEKRVKIVSGTSGEGGEAQPAWANSEQPLPSAEVNVVPASMTPAGEPEVPSREPQDDMTASADGGNQEEITVEAPGANDSTIEESPDATPPPAPSEEGDATTAGEVESEVEEQAQNEPEDEAEVEVEATLEGDGEELEEANIIGEEEMRLEAERQEDAEAERNEANRIAAEEAALEAAERQESEEAARLDAERQSEQEAILAAAEKAKADEAERLDAERKAAEEAARLDAERRAAEEAARLEAERKAAEEAARLEAERKAAEESARLEAERKAAEESARLEAERKAAEEAARLEAERKAAEDAAKLEAERKAAEEAARLEAERKAAELATQELERQRQIAADAANALKEAEARAAEAAAAQAEAEQRVSEAAAARAEAERRAAARAVLAHAESLTGAQAIPQTNSQPGSQIEIPQETYRTPGSESSGEDSPPSEGLQQAMAHAAELAEDSAADHSKEEFGIDTDEATRPNSPLQPPPLPPKS